MDDELKDILRQVKRIELRTRQAMNDLTAGAYKSRFRGQGMEFEEVREYVPGDDVRTIDWNVSARANKPFVKVFREERELTVMLLVDLSGSMQFGAIPGLPGAAGNPRSKMSAAAEAAAVIAITAMQNKDKIGLIGFHESTVVHVQPRRGRNHSMRLIREILSHNHQAHSTDLAHAIDELMRVNRKRSVCFIVSDFLTPDSALGDILSRAARRHDIVGLRIHDPSECHLPTGTAPMMVQDPESDETLCLANNKKIQAQYQRAWKQQQEQTEKYFRSAGCDLLDLSTDMNCIAAIQRFFQKRRRTR